MISQPIFNFVPLDDNKYVIGQRIEFLLNFRSGPYRLYKH